MRLITYVENMRQLGAAKEAGLEQVILQPKALSRFGRLEFEEANELAREARKLGIQAVLEWDVLMTENEMQNAPKYLQALDLDSFHSIRAQDAGAIEIALEQTDKKIQLILETGNHNLSALKAWRDYAGERLERLVLSIELTGNTLREYREALNVPIEFLVLGRILLFYSPRSLLSPLSGAEELGEERPWLSAIGESEESPHKGFPVEENRHGTFMFHMKRQFLLEHLDELDFVDWVRADFRFDPDFDQIFATALVVKGEMSGKDFKKNYPFDTMKGFYKVNKSDVLFKKLKNRRIQRQDENYVGEVLEIQKGKHMALRLKGKIAVRPSMRLKFVTPEGKELVCPVVELKDSAHNDLKEAMPESLALMNYFGGVWVRSQVYLAE